MISFFKPATMVKPDAALPGRSVALPTAAHHFVNGHALKGPFPDGFSQVQLGMGCFWGAERLFWELPGVWVTAVGYSGGFTPNPTYEEVCSGRTGHAETVLVVFDPNAISLERVLKAFWEGHDPTQGMRQGNDRGTQYRSCVFVDGDTELATVRSSLNAYQEKLRAGGYGEITTEIGAAPEFYYAEDYHQQYLAKNPRGYCGLGGTGVTCPVGVNA